MSEWVSIVALLAFGAAIVLAWLWRSALAESARLVEEAGRAATRERELEQTLARESAARKRQADDLAAHRKRSEKTRKRQSKPGAQPLGTASRIQELEATIGRLREESEHTRAEKDALAVEVARLRTAAASPDPAPAKPAPAEAVAAAPPADAAREEELTRLRERLSEGEARAAKLEQELAEDRKTGAGLRRRLEKQELLYVALRGELEAKKDRLRTQEEQLQRLQALKVAIADEPAAPETP